jgi:PhzF family phenazine biosynthesis protein
MRKFQKTIIHSSVFGDGPNGGNPCPVVLDGDDLKTEHGKQLASIFGAETIIVLKSKETDSDLGLRYFVPKYEMEMCVHGTIIAQRDFILLPRMIQGQRTRIRHVNSQQEQGTMKILPQALLHVL